MSLRITLPTAEAVTEGVDLSGKVAVITGVNSGLGYESMRVLCLRGAHVIGTARTLDKARQACESVQGQASPVACELGEPESVLAATERIIEISGEVDILLCNAGIMAPAELGIVHAYSSPLELQFATNHMGHFLLTQRLLPALHEAESARIVVTSSMGHVHTPKGGIDFDNLDAAQGYKAMAAYGQSKLANILMCRELASRLAGSNVTANAVHPGVIRTQLDRSSAGLLKSLMRAGARLVERSIAQGAATQCYVAAHPALDGVSGQYFADCRPKTPSKYAQDPMLAARLWDHSELLAQKYL